MRLEQIDRIAGLFFEKHQLPLRIGSGSRNPVTKRSVRKARFRANNSAIRPTDWQVFAILEHSLICVSRLPVDFLHFLEKGTTPLLRTVYPEIVELAVISLRLRQICGFRAEFDDF
jgi:hypothetical protein